MLLQALSTNIKTAAKSCFIVPLRRSLAPTIRVSRPPRGIRAAGDFLDGQLGPDETQWAWGRLHGLLLSSDLSLFQVFEFDNPAPGESLFANDGGLFTVDVANPSQQPGQEFVQTAGPSMRFVCEASPTGPTCTIQLPGGQSSDIESPYYEDLLFPYLAKEPMPLVFDIGEAAANAEQTINFP